MRKQKRAAAPSQQFLPYSVSHRNPENLANPSESCYEFAKSNYDDIKKVYSIWICMDAPDEKSAINVYNMQERHLLHITKAEKNHYDLLSIIMIYLGADNSSNDLIRFLGKR